MSKHEEFLKSFHAKHPGCTSEIMSRAEDEQGRTSYGLLSQLIPHDLECLSVLDIACGDGFLLEQIAQRKIKGIELFGIDMSEAELAAAEKRLHGRAQLHLGRTQSLAFSNSSMDFVLCHMAFMLMDSIEEVISEVKRVLKPNGTFSAVVSGGGFKFPASDIFRELSARNLKKESMEFLWQIGDERTRNEEGLRKLFSTAKSLNVQAISMSVFEPIDIAVHYYMTFYGPALLTASEYSNLKLELRERFVALAGPRKLVECGHGIIQITAQL